MPTEENHFIIQGVFADAERSPSLSEVWIDRTTGLIARVNSDISSFVDHPDFCCDPSKYILPGFLDIHVHAREDQTSLQNGKETYQTALDAASNGGVVCVCAMPNTPEPATNREHFKWHRQKVSSLNHHVQCLNYLGVGKETSPLDRKKHIYKVYTGPSVGSLFFKNPGELDAALKKYEGENLSFHVEDFELLEANKHRGNHSLRRPPECVLKALEYLLPMIEKYSIQAKLCHWSVGKESIKMIEAHRNRMENLKLGYNTTVEVSPMHLFFNSEELEKTPERWPFVQMNPAIQSFQHQQDLITALRDGVIDYLATDHAPHKLEEKFSRFEALKSSYPGLSNEQIYEKTLKEDPDTCAKICLENGVSGAPWLDTYGIVVSYLKNELNFDLKTLAKITATSPAAFVNPYLEKSEGKGYGQIKTGHKACFTVMDFQKEITVSRECLMTKNAWSPLENRKFTGFAEGVLVKDGFYPSKYGLPFEAT